MRDLLRIHRNSCSSYQTGAGLMGHGTTQPWRHLYFEKSQGFFDMTTRHFSDLRRIRLVEVASSPQLSSHAEQQTVQPCAQPKAQTSHSPLHLRSLRPGLPRTECGIRRVHLVQGFVSLFWQHSGHVAPVFAITSAMYCCACLPQNMLSWRPQSHAAERSRCDQLCS